MSICRRLTTKDVALTAVFAALYVVFSFLPLSQVIGLFGKAITVATIIAPIIGIVLGSYLGVASTLSGGIVGVFFSPYFSPPGLVAGVITALFAGLLYARRRSICIVVYLSFLLLFGFYPLVGPVWLYPPLMGFQIVGLLILISPLQSLSIKNLNSNDNSRLLFAFFITFLTSTLAGQIAGSLAFEAYVVGGADFFKVYWPLVTLAYPVERTIIALAAAFIGVALYKAVRSTNLTQLLTRTK
jgi:hypothetical protein